MLKFVFVLLLDDETGSKQAMLSLRRTTEKTKKFSLRNNKSLNSVELGIFEGSEVQQQQQHPHCTITKAHIYTFTGRAKSHFIS